MGYIHNILVEDLEDIGLDGKIILKQMLKNQGLSVYCIKLAWDGVQWCTLVNMVMNLLVP
jgi:hypothetical protein